MAEWRDVPGFEGTLIACDDGRVARVTGFSMGYGYEGISVNHLLGSHPVLTSGLTVSSRGSYVIPTHRIIALTFLGEPPEGKNFVNHKDGVKENNPASNLEWCSCAENLAHARETGLTVPKLKKYTDDQYCTARELWASGNWRFHKLAEHLGVTRGGLGYMIYGKRKCHG